MRGFSDEFLEQRIIWKIEQTAPSKLEKLLYKESQQFLPEAARRFGESGDIGRPFLAVVDNDTRWTLLGTEAVVYQNNDAVRAFKLDSFEAVEAVEPLQGAAKLQLEYHLITDNEGDAHLVWTPQGATSLAFGAVLLMLKRMQRRI
jgi:hypothetical protein